MPRSQPTIAVAITPPQNPTTPAEWQTAVDAASALLTLHSARLYGLVTGGPTVNAERCNDLLERGRAYGYHPAADAVERLAGEIGVAPEAKQ